MKDVGLSRRRRNQKGRPALNVEEVPPRRTSDSSSPPLSTTSNSDALSTSTPGTEPTAFEGEEATTLENCHTGDNYCMALRSSIDVAPGEYWHLRSTSTIDLSFLTILTNFNISRASISSLAGSSSRLPTVLNHHQWSYLEYIPQRYPHSPCLAAATDCILTRVGIVLSPCPGGESSALRLYAKALRLVQAAVSSTFCTDPDVLCAVQLLSLHELFDVSGSSAWASHVEGSARLIKHRSVGRIETEFEKALFAASVGPYISECLY